MTKKTKYFLSNFRTRSQLQECIDQAESKRDKFLSENEQNIEEIETESIQILYTHQDSVAALISLTFYLKK